MTIILEIAVFVAIIWLLVAILLLARKKFVPEGKVKITINDEKVVEHERGCTLLQALNDEQIYMPSACGGKGTCGTCKGIVKSGGGIILPNELPHLSKKLQEQNYRLFCQVKVRDDISIKVPDEIFGIKKWDCEVVSNNNIATFIKELVLKLPQNETLDFRSGEYIQVYVPKCSIRFSDFTIDRKYQQDWQDLNLFNLTMKNPEPTVRAYSMANPPSENNIIRLNVRIATPPFDKKKHDFKKVNPGVCSSYIFSLKPSDKITLSGTYGDFFVRDNDNEMMFIGGGAGMAPLRSHILDQFKTKHTSRKTTFWYGGRSVRELFYIDDFEQLEKENDNFEFHIALSEPLPTDKWEGYTGFIHQVIYENYLKHHPHPEDIEYYICGPPLMLSAVLEMLDSLGVPKDMICYDDFGG